MNIDYEYKSRLLVEGLPDLYKRVKGSEYLHYYNRDEKAYTLPYDDADCLDELMQLYRAEDWKESSKIAHADIARAVRLYKRIGGMIEAIDGGVFLTITFNDDTLHSTSEKTRRAYVCRFLKSLGVPYVANIDYGSQNEREHYHAVVQAHRVDYTLWHCYGAIKGEKIALKSGAERRLGKYVSKLSNHAIKATARRCHLIYSR